MNIETLESIANLLILSLSPQHTQEATFKLLELENSFNEFASYLLHIITSFRLRDNHPDFKMVAGVRLKNCIKLNYDKFPIETKQSIQKQLPLLMIDNDSNLRLTAASIITTIIEKDKRPWEDLFNAIHQILSSITSFVQDFSKNLPEPTISPSEFVAIDGASYTLMLLCDDHSFILDSSDFGRPILVFFPDILKLVRHPNACFRERGLSCLNLLIVNLSPSVSHFWDQMREAVFAVASDSNPKVCAQVCRCFCLINELQSDLLEDYLSKVVEIMLLRSTSSDNTVALEACEFWKSMAEREHNVSVKHLGPILGTLVPLLISHLVFSKEHIEHIENECAYETKFGPRSEEVHPGMLNKHTTSLELNNDNSNDDFDDDDDELSQWSLRKCAAASFDALSLVFKDALLPYVLPLVQERFQCLSLEQWPLLESAILIVGAISEGCEAGMQNHIVNVTNFLIGLLGSPSIHFQDQNKTKIHVRMHSQMHPHPFVRQITCWTLSRYARSIADEDEKTTSNQTITLLSRVLSALLVQMLDQSPRVQMSACSAVSVLFEETQNSSFDDEDVETNSDVPTLTPIHILQCFASAFRMYGRKNTTLLHDCITTLCTVDSSSITSNEAISILLPCFFTQWDGTSDDDELVLSLFPCFGAYIAALGDKFNQWALIVFKRCLAMAEKTVTKFKLYYSVADQPYPQKNFAVSAFNMMSSLCDALGQGVRSVFLDPSNTINPNAFTPEVKELGSDGSARMRLMTVLFHAMNTVESTLRQSACGLCGDIAKLAPEIILPNTSQIIPVMIPFIDQTVYTSICNNAVWCFGELVFTSNESVFQPFLSEILPRLFTLLPIESLHRTLRANLAICVGRFALKFTNEIAQHNESILESWFHAFRLVYEDDEKHSAFSGICKSIAKNPRGAMKSFPLLCFEISKYKNPPNELKALFSSLLSGFKAMLGQEWNNYYSQFSVSIRGILKTRYGLD